MIKVSKPLKEMFGDVDYAWELLESEIKFEISQEISSEDISYILQLYMKGVEKMNSQIDVRESFFKNKVTSLMSRPAVIRILNQKKPMSKKSETPVIDTGSERKVQGIRQLQLKQKRKQMQMRMAYGAEEHKPEKLQRLIIEQNQKQSFLSQKIDKIVCSHEDRLMQRIKQRKMRTMTAKSRSQINLNNDLGNEATNSKLKTFMMEKKRDEEQFGNVEKGKKKIVERKYKSASPKKAKMVEQETSSPTRRRVSMDLSKDQIKLMEFVLNS